MELPTSIIINFSKTPIAPTPGKQIIQVGSDKITPPDKADVSSPMSKLAEIPGKIWGMAELAAEEAATNASAEMQAAIQQYRDAAKAVQDKIDMVRDVIGENFPVTYPDPAFPDQSNPGMEWEKRMDAILREYPTFPVLKILDILKAIIPGFTFQVPIMGLQCEGDSGIDLMKLFTDAEYVACLKLKIGEQIDTYYAMLPEDLQFYSDDLEMPSTETSISLKVQTFMETLMVKAKDALINLYTSAINTLVSKLKAIVGFPAIPAIPTINTTLNDLDSLIEIQYSKVGTDYNDRVEALEDLHITLTDYANIPTIFDIRKMLGLDEMEDPKTQYDSHISSERIIERYVQTMREFISNWNIKKYMQFMQDIKDKILNYAGNIGLPIGNIADYLPMDFSKFLETMGFPSQIEIPLPTLPVTPA